LGIVILSPGL
jgi:hypothetical protein